MVTQVSEEGLIHVQALSDTICVLSSTNCKLVVDAYNTDLGSLYLFDVKTQLVLQRINKTSLMTFDVSLGK